MSLSEIYNTLNMKYKIPVHNSNNTIHYIKIKMTKVPQISHHTK